MSRCVMPTPRSTTGYAILGLLGLRSWTTYELAKQVQRSLSWFWPRAERKLYDEPKRLVADGLALASAESTGKRPRTVYAITTDGRAALRDWLDEPPAPRTTEFEGMVKVFFADAGTIDQLRTTLDRIADEAQARLDEVATLAGIWLDDPAFPARAHLGAVGLELAARPGGGRAALGELGPRAGRPVARRPTTPATGIPTRSSADSPTTDSPSRMAPKRPGGRGQS